MARIDKNVLQWVEPEVPSTPSPPWIELPRDLTVNILERLDVIERLHVAQKVCTTWCSVCRYYPHMWRVIDMSKSALEGHDLTPRYLDILCRRAVDRSQGQLVDISMYGFCTKALLRYIAKRCSQLQCLTVVFRDKVSEKAFNKAVKRLPLLIELHLIASYYTRSHVSSDNNFDIEAIGRSCPMLKSFLFSNRCDVINEMFSEVPNDVDVLAVAENMCGLRHLGLLGNAMSGSALEAILNGCLHLESLRFQLSWKSYYKSKDIIERCHRRIRKVVWYKSIHPALPID